jgi:hypothetical protein
VHAGNALTSTAVDLPHVLGKAPHSFGLDAMCLRTSSAHMIIQLYT